MRRGHSAHGVFPVRPVLRRPRRWEQIYNTAGDTANSLSIAAHFPLIKLVHWFDYVKARRAPAANPGHLQDWHAAVHADDLSQTRDIHCCSARRPPRV